MESNPEDACPFKDLPDIPARHTICERGLDDECQTFGSLLDLPFRAGPNGRDEPIVPSINPFEKPKSV